MQSVKGHKWNILLNKLTNAYWMYSPNIPLPPFLSHLSMFRVGSVILEGTPFQQRKLEANNTLKVNQK